MGRLILRPEQQAVLDGYRGGYAAIAAVPGSGKTTTLSALAAEQIASKRISHYQRIVIVTYQNAAVANFQRQMRERLAERNLPDRGYIVRTHHGLAADILRATRHRRLIDAETRIADAGEANALKAAAFKSTWNANAEMIRSRLGFDEHQFWQFTNDTYLYSQLGLQPMMLLQIHRSRISTTNDSPWISALLPVLDEYTSRLREAGLLDYDGLLTSALEALQQNPELCRLLQVRWKYLLEDEAQDCTPLQTQILNHLAGPHGNLVRVGDTNQAILTSFTAGDVEYFRTWCDEPNVTTYPLYGSSRSQPAIVKVANRFVKWVCNEFPLDEARNIALDDRTITTIDGENPPVPQRMSRGIRIREFKCNTSEQREVLERALGYLELNPKARVAVLVGRKATGYGYANRALLPDKDRSFPLGFPDGRLIRLLGNEDGRAIPVISKLFELITFLQLPTQGSALTNALATWSSNSDIDQALKLIGTHEGDIENLLYPPGRVPLAGTEFDDEVSQQTLRRLRAIPTLLDNRLLAPHELIALITSTIEPSEPDQIILTSLVSRARVVELPKADDRLAQLLKWLDQIRASKVELRGNLEQHLIEIDEGTLTIATRHQAKGLEWDIVFAVECDDFWFPTHLNRRSPTFNDVLRIDPVSVAVAEIQMQVRGSSSLSNSQRKIAVEDVSEAMRVLYVTITRARHACWISWHRKGDRPRSESVAIRELGRLMQEVRDEINT